MKKTLLLLCFFLIAAAAPGAEIVGRVVGVSDGDTVTVLDALDNGRFRVRLAGIDAPEKRQPFGQKAKQHLSGLIYGKTVSIRFTEIDRYGRIVGRIHLDGSDVCLAMIAAGFAWHYVQYDATPAYAAAEAQARAARIGLWADPAPPVPPGEYRRAEKEK